MVAQVHIKDPLLLIDKSSLCGDSGFLLKIYVTMTICWPMAEVTPRTTFLLVSVDQSTVLCVPV